MKYKEGEKIKVELEILAVSRLDDKSVKVKKSFEDDDTWFELKYLESIEIPEPEFKNGDFVESDMNVLAKVVGQDPNNSDFIAVALCVSEDLQYWKKNDITKIKTITKAEAEKQLGKKIV